RCFAALSMTRWAFLPCSGIARGDEMLRCAQHDKIGLLFHRTGFPCRSCYYPTLVTLSAATGLVRRRDDILSAANLHQAGPLSHRAAFPFVPRVTPSACPLSAPTSHAELFDALKVNSAKHLATSPACPRATLPTCHAERSEASRLSHRLSPQTLP